MTSNPTPGHIFGENHNSESTCTLMFTEALFTIARTWKQPKCPSAEEWIKCGTPRFNDVRNWC